jgi:hypothetical protein
MLSSLRSVRRASRSAFDVLEVDWTIYVLCPCFHSSPPNVVNAAANRWQHESFH